jgi:hypothetical protein
MNYLKTYIKLIRKAQKRKNVPEIIEEHHVFPQGIYGKNNYKVNLSPREHYVAHALLHKALVKRYGFKHDKSVKMWYAFWCMHAKNPYQSYRYVNSRLYERLKTDFYTIYNPFLKNGKNHPAYGYVRSEETKRKQGKTFSCKYSGENSIMFGRHWYNNGVKNTIAFECPPGFVFGRLSPSEKTRLKIGKAGKGRKVSQKTRDLISKTHRELRANNQIKDCSNTKWFTNGKTSVRRFECPQGFKPGRTPRKKPKDTELKSDESS